VYDARRDIAVDDQWFAAGRTTAFAPISFAVADGVFIEQ
jgi:hypothetical protein